MTEAEVCTLVGAPDHYQSVGHGDKWDYVRGGKLVLRIAFNHGTVESYGGLAVARAG